MKSLALVAFVSGCGGVVTKSTIDENAAHYQPNTGNICMLAGEPPEEVEYEIIGRIVATKRSYGGTDELLPPMAFEARRLGADAIINLQADQRFKGPLPWRVRSPTGDGQAIKVLGTSPSLDCIQSGGKLYGPDGRESLVSGTSNSRSLPKSDDDPAPTSAATNSPQAQQQSSDVDLYTELMKLDDLRNRGILTDAEFEQEKKKVLERN